MRERDGADTGRDLDRVLADLRALSEDIESCAVLSGAGDLLSSSHAAGVDRERVAAMLAGVLLVVPLLAFGDDALVGAITTTLGNIVGYVFTTPFQAAVIALVYFDLRVRKEGLDLELLAEDVGVPPEEVGSEPTPLAPPFPPWPPPAPGAGAGQAPAAPPGWSPPRSPTPPRPADE